MRFRNLRYRGDEPIEVLGAAAIDDLLDRGDLGEWQALARAIRAEPAGALAETVLRLCEAHPMYGTSHLWRWWIEGLRSERPARRAGSLRALRRVRGLTQQVVGDRLGMTQADVSKLERREDVRLSTLRAYVAATGGELELRARYPDATAIEIPSGFAQPKPASKHVHDRSGEQ